MRKHCSNVCKLRPCLDNESKKLGTHAQHHDRSTAAAIFANGTYFLDNPRRYNRFITMSPFLN